MNKDIDMCERHDQIWLYDEIKIGGPHASHNSNYTHPC